MPPFLLSIAERYIQPVFTTTSNFLSWAPRLAVERLVAKWRSLLTIIVGVILGAGIGALVPLYTTAVSQVGMVQRLADEPPHDSNARLRISLNPADFASLDDMLAAATIVENDVVRSESQHYLNTGDLDGWLGNDDIAGFVETDKLGLAVTDGQYLTPLNGEGNARGRLTALDDWEQQVRVVAGQLPDQAEVPEGVHFNVAISTTIANEFGLEVGDTLIVDQRLPRNQPTPQYEEYELEGWDSSQPFVVQVSAIVAARDEESSYWMAIRGEDDTPLAIIPEYRSVEIRLLTSRETVLSVGENFVPQTPVTFGWHFLFQHDELSYSHIEEAREALKAFDSDLQPLLGGDNPGVVPQFNLADGKTTLFLNYNYHTRLIDFSQTRSDLDRGILLDYSRQQKTNAVPFTLLLLEVGALVLFFLMVTAALVRRGERREISMLQSRGAHDGHILALRGIEAMLICVFGAILAPFLAQQLLVALGPSVAGTNEFPLPLTARVFSFSLIAGGLTFVALTMTLIPVLRLPLISAGGAALRSEKAAWWQRYYVDVVLASVGLVALILLIRRDTPLLESSAQEQKIDPLLVLAPALLFLGLGSIALRVFPLVATAVNLTWNRRPGVLGPLATWQLSREPVHYGRITFLLALAVGIGWFATSFRATVSRSQTDQAHYRVGTDVRLMERDTTLNVDRVRNAEFYENFEDVLAASMVYRTRVNLSRTGQVSRGGEILAIDARDLGPVVIEDWRPDLGNIAVPYEDFEVPVMPVVGEPLPLQSARIALWARFDLDALNAPGQNIPGTYVTAIGQLTQRIQLNVRLQDDSGTWLIAPLQQVRVEYVRGDGQDQPGFRTSSHVSSGWAYYEADLTQLGYVPQGELRLVSIFWDYRTNGTSPFRNRLYLAGVSLIDEAGTSHPYDILTNEGWVFVTDTNSPADGGIQEGLVTDNLHGEPIYVEFTQPATRTRVGINLNYPAPQVIPVVLSDTMAEFIDVRFYEDENQEMRSDPETFTIENIAGANLIFRPIPQLVTEYFPSLYNDERPYIVVDVQELMYALNYRPSSQFYPNEVWLKLEDNVSGVDDVDGVISQLIGGDDSGVERVQAFTFADEYDQLETNPLALGLLGLMFLAFLIALVLSIVGLVTYAGLTAQARRSEFGVLRALGLSSTRVVLSLIFEQIFVVILAGLLGSVLGHVLSVFVVPTLALGTAGEGVVPPFITEIEWAAIGRFWLIMLVVIIAVFSFSFVLVRQLSLSRTLRLGDE